MIDKVNFSNYNDDMNSSKEVNKKVSFKGNDDSFEKVSEKTDEETELKNTAMFYLKRKKFTKLVNDLIKDNYWTDFSEYVGFNKDNGKLFSVNIGINDEESEIITLDLNDFRDVMLQVTAYNIINKPEKESEYKKLYVDLIKHINKNMVKD